MKRLIIAISILALASCVEYHPTPTQPPQPTSWKHANSSAESVSMPRSQIYGVTKWWEIFNDPLLNKLQEQALIQNPAFMVALARLEQAQGLVVSVRANQFPQLNLGASATRQRQSPDSFPPTTTSSSTPPMKVAIPGAPGASGAPGTPPLVGSTPATADVITSKVQFLNSQLLLLPAVSYEADLWGYYWQSTQAARMSAAAAQEAVSGGCLLLTTQLAATYYQIRAFDAVIALQHALVEGYREERAINTALYRGGANADLDALQNDVAVNRAQEALDATINQRAMAEDFLAVLVGVAASDFVLPPAPYNPVIPTIPAGLPSTILIQRPDVRQSTDVVEQQRLLVGVAKSAFFPQITLGANAGYESHKTSKLFAWKNRTWALTAALLGPIFDGGALWGNFLQAKAQYQEAVGAFLQTVVQAYQDVEDALASIQAARDRHAASKRALRDAVEITALTFLQYSDGTINYLNVLAAELDALQAEIDTIQTTQEQVVATLTLIKGLGGSWE